MRPTEISDNDQTGLNNAIETSGFKFDQNNAFFFRALINDLYSDKVPSVVREIIANAIDAHAMAKVKPTRPVEVNLPTMFAPQFSVRDFGDGMTHEFVMELYSTIGHSSKTRTNVATGMFGLGAKTPFAVADSFEVRVYDNGIERQYRCGYNAKQCPEIAFVQKLPTSEPNGVKMTVEITDHGQFSQFERAIEKAALCYFDQPVKFNRKTSSGVDMLQSAADSVKKYGTRFYTRRGSSSSYRSNTIYVRQGFAVYPLDLTKVGLTSLGLLQSDDILRSVVDTSYGEIMIDCPIGTFEVTPSREAIQYTERSIKKLVELIAPEIEAVRDELYALIGDAKTFPEAALKLLKAPTDSLSVYQEAATRAGFYSPRISDNFLKYAAKTQLNVADWSRPSYVTSANGFEPVFDKGSPGVFLHGAHRKISFSRNSLAACGFPSVYMYNIVTSASDDACTASRVNDVALDTATPLLVIPTDLRGWEDRAHHYIRSTQKWVSLKHGQVQSIVVRLPRTDLQLFKEFIAAHNALLFSEFDDTKFVESPKAITPKANRVSRPRPAFNDVQEIDSSGVWSKKSGVDFDEPCFIVVRDKRHGVIDIADAQTIADFDAKKLGADAKFGGLKLRPSTNEYNLGKLIKAWRAIGALDTTTPIYSLTRAQAEAVEKQGFALSRLGDHMIASLSRIVPRFLAAMTTAQALKQSFSSAIANTAATINDGMLKKSSLEIAARLSEDPFVLATFAVTQLTSTSLTASTIIPQSAVDMAREARMVQGRFDDAIGTLTENYTELFAAACKPIVLDHSGARVYNLLPHTYELANNDVMDEALQYVKDHGARVTAKHTKMATDFLSKLPAPVLKVVAEIMQAVRAHFLAEEAKIKQASKNSKAQSVAA